MTDIIRQRQEERRIAISKIQALIMAEIKNHRKFTKKEMVVSAMSLLIVSKRTASEYVDVALHNEGITI